MIGDRHPDFPLLYVAKESNDGQPLAYATTGPYFSVDDPRVVLTDREGRRVQHHPTHTDRISCKPDTLAA
jgi:hypothetical protein